jgi:hypothetical protein
MDGWREGGMDGGKDGEVDGGMERELQREMERWRDIIIFDSFIHIYVVKGRPLCCS